MVRFEGVGGGAVGRQSDRTGVIREAVIVRHDDQWLASQEVVLLELAGCGDGVVRRWVGAFVCWRGRVRRRAAVLRGLSLPPSPSPSLSPPLSLTHRIVAKLALPDARDGGELPLLRGTRVVRRPQRHHQHHHSHMSAASSQHSVGSSRPSPSPSPSSSHTGVRAACSRLADEVGGRVRPERTDG